MEFIEHLNWRYATKRMNGNKVPADKLNRILEAIRLSASGMGMQPYKVLVIEDEELRRQIHPVAFSQPQIVESSHLLVFAAWNTMGQTEIDEYINRIASTRSMDVSNLDGFKSNIQGFTQSKTDEQLYEWAARQAYIALGTGLAAAAIEKVDASPMEGFNPAALDELLGLKERGLRSVSLMALGYRDEQNDFLLGAPKVRRSRQDLFIEMPAAAL